MVARFAPTMSQVVMAYFGVQYREEPTSSGGFKALHHIGGAFGSERGPGSWVSGSFAPDIGAFAEILKPGVQRFETLFSSGTPEGVACLAAGFSDVVQEHAYWGGARDRIAMSQTDAMTPSGARHSARQPVPDSFRTGLVRN
jgi:aldoxime dehydratase